VPKLDVVNGTLRKNTLTHSEKR